MADVVPPTAAEQPIPWWGKFTLAWGVLALFGYALVMVLMDKNSQYQQLMLACIIGLITGALGYYFGSSSSSDKKDTTIAANTAALASSTPAPPPATAEPSEPSDEVKALAAKVTGTNAP